MSSTTKCNGLIEDTVIEPVFYLLCLHGTEFDDKELGFMLFSQKFDSEQ